MCDVMQYKLGSTRPKTNLMCRRLPTVVPLFHLIFSKLTNIPVHDLAARSNCVCYFEKLNKKQSATVLILHVVSLLRFCVCKIHQNQLLWKHQNQLLWKRFSHKMHQSYAMLCLCSILPTASPNFLEHLYGTVLT